MLIPKMLLICIKNERSDVFVKITKGILSLEHYRKHIAPNKEKIRRELISAKTKAWWESLSETKKEKFCKKRGKSLKKYLKGLTPEQRAVRSLPANKKLRELYKCPIRGKHLRENNLKRMADINSSVVYEETPRINNYSGAITESQMEELYA